MANSSGSSRTIPDAQLIFARFRKRHWQVSLSGLQRCHINHKAVFHITFQHAFVRFIDILNLNHFDICSDTMLAAEIEHFLGLGDAADERAGEAAASEEKAEGRVPRLPG